jgi:hypothetical protein
LQVLVLPAGMVACFYAFALVHLSLAVCCVVCLQQTGIHVGLFGSPSSHPSLLFVIL